MAPPAGPSRSASDALSDCVASTPAVLSERSPRAGVTRLGGDTSQAGRPQFGVRILSGPDMLKPGGGSVVVGVIRLAFPAAPGTGTACSTGANDGLPDAAQWVNSSGRWVMILATSLSIEPGGSGGIFGPARSSSVSACAASCTAWLPACLTCQP